MIEVYLTGGTLEPEWMKRLVAHDSMILSSMARLALGCRGVSSSALHGCCLGLVLLMVRLPMCLPCK
jgi:hypothetical protein